MSLVDLNGSINAYSGRIGRIVFSDTKKGTTARQYVIPENPRTPAQVANRLRFRKATLTYGTLTPAQLAQWRAYAARQTERSRSTGNLVARKANNVFAELAARFLHVTPAGTVPLSPPAAPFLGDIITLTASGGNDVVEFTASGASASGLVVELLLQPLASAVRAPEDSKYGHRAYTTFTLASPSEDVVAPAGWYAPAYRFVKTSTGQSTPLVPLEVIQVS